MKMLIDAKHVDAKNGTTFENRNPFDGTLICTVPNGTEEDFERAALVARKAQKEWAKTPIYIRSRILTTFVGLVRLDFDKIVSVVEVMGRHAGFLALYVGLACGATSVLVPEHEYNFDHHVAAKIRQARLSGKTNFTVVVAEGAASAVDVGKQIQEELGIKLFFAFLVFS